MPEYIKQKAEPKIVNSELYNILANRGKLSSRNIILDCTERDLEVHYNVSMQYNFLEISHIFVNPAGMN
jgi:hypothetical protein